MDFSAPSPESSSSDSRSSYSPRFMTDLGLDPSDPLNLLLHNSSQSGSGDSSMEESSCEGGSPPDWSQLSALWPESDLGHTKPFSDVMDFGNLSSLPMDMDFNPSMSIEPSALNFDPMKFSINYPYDEHNTSYSNDLLAPQFPFTFQSPYSGSDLSSSNASPQLSTQERRLSTASSPSFSGDSLSPASEPAPSPASNYSNTMAQPFMGNPSQGPSDAIVELAERVRQAAGVMLALPMSAQLQALEMNQQAAAAATSNTPTIVPKLPIPRLPRHISHSVKSTSTLSSAASTPPPSTPSPPPVITPTSASGQATPSMTQAALPRPKTSHTTIERRYRTNLNARIQSLRMAVPALRVVEDRDGGKKRAPNKVLVTTDGVKLEGNPQGIISADGVLDVIDERGFVDGVKVARKCSKANVLGKAVEYIRVLKKRENRLKAEQSGLRSLISGLVGGPALLREWEREWKEKFGGAEKDEVEGEMEAEPDEDDSDEEQDDVDEEGGRKRKRGKTAAVPGVKKEKADKEKKPIQDPNGTAPEKRKRGRPRKIIPVVPPTSLLENHDQLMEPSAMVQSGTAVTHEHSQPQQYLLATFALFSFFNSPLTSSSSSSSSHTHSGAVLNAPRVLASRESWGMTEYTQMVHLLISIVVLLSFISSWIGFGFGFGGRNLPSIGWRYIMKKQKRSKADWIKLGEECIFAEPKQDVSLYTRIQIYYHISSSAGVGAQELSTAAMVLYGAEGMAGGIARAKARSVWAAAAAKASLKGGATVHEKMVLEEMSIDKAVEHLTKTPILAEGKSPSPMQILASTLLNDRVKKHLALLFVGSVRAGSDDDKDKDKDIEEKDKTDKEIVERRRTIEAAKELGGHAGELGRTLERVWKLGVNCQTVVEDIRGDESGVDGELKALLAAVVLYRRLFASMTNGSSALLSPPPSPGRKDASEAGILRRVLGSRVFEEWDGLEDARDRAVDMVVELERRSVGLE